MNLLPTRHDGETLRQYAALFAACFPGASHLDERYLGWLYRDNPAGPVVGFDAWEGDQLAAHYVCIPAPVRIGGTVVRALLSLNTATHPSFQGKGLFTKLADRTYARGAEEGFAAVYGVANANSTPGFVRKLGFGLVCPLDAWVGVGRLPGITAAAVAGADFERQWAAPDLAWRMANPASPVHSVALSDGTTGFSARSGRPGVRAWAQLPGDLARDARAGAGVGARVFLGKVPGAAGTRGAYVRIPDRLRPSPLNLILRGLDRERTLDPRNLAFSFLDFDAF